MALDILIDAFAFVPATAAWGNSRPRRLPVADARSRPSVSARRGPAIDAFLELVSGSCEVLLRKKQVIVRKVSSN
jgi:hypothetical protein